VAVPFRFPKALYGLIALLVVSSGLVSIRYFYGHSLNLSAPITEVVFQDLAAAKQAKAAKAGRIPEKEKEFDEARSLLAKLGLGADLQEKPEEQLDEALAAALKSGEKSQGSGEDAKPGEKQDGDPLDSPDAKNDSSQGGEGAPAGDDNKKASEASESSTSQSGAKSGEKSDKSLLSKLKDAMDNMMGAPGPKSDKKGGGQKQQSKPGSQQPQQGQQAGEAGDEQDKSPADGEANGNPQKGSSPGQTSGNGTDKQEGPSAAGAEDGVKAIKAAAQLKAMGKISELLGKRADQVSGESMVEVQSGNQKLQTAYKDSAATHGEGAGDVSRDQIPVSVQAYVQEYFQQVRKQGAPAKAPATPAKP
jgi:hypothetical protein